GCEKCCSVIEDGRRQRFCAFWHRRIHCNSGEARLARRRECRGEEGSIRKENFREQRATRSRRMAAGPAASCGVGIQERIGFHIKLTKATMKVSACRFSLPFVVTLWPLPE